MVTKWSCYSQCNGKEPLENRGCVVLISWVITYSQEAGQFTSLWEFLKRFNQIHPSTLLQNILCMFWLYLSCKEVSDHNDCCFVFGSFFVFCFWFFVGFFTNCLISYVINFNSYLIIIILIVRCFEEKRSHIEKFNINVIRVDYHIII